MDRDCNLYVSPYDQERGVYRRSKDVLVMADDEARFINIGSDKIYFIHYEAEKDSLMQMDFDGGNVETLLSNEGYWGMQYARLTDGREYLYYLIEDENPSGNAGTLCRYDLEQGTVQTLLEGIYDFSLYGSRIYYTVISAEDTRESAWKCAGLDGQEEKVLNDSDNLIDGYVEDGTAYMYSLKDEMLYQYDLEGNKRDDSMLMRWGDCSVYGDGWIYYSRENSNEVHRVCADGTYDEIVLEGHNISRICYGGSFLWMLQTKEVDGEKVLEQTFLMNKKGKTITLERAYTDMMPEGLEYRIEEDELVLIGYTGDESRIVIPWEVDRKSITSVRREESFPESVDLYFYPREDELTYELTEDGTGAVLTGCGGTDVYPFRILPAEIDGMPLVKLGDELFKDNTSIQGIILPEGLEVIGDSTFWGASELAYVRLPDTLKSIGSGAFVYTRSLSEIILPEGLEDIRDNAFASGNLRTVLLPSTLKLMVGNPFGNTLESIALADGIQGFFLENGAVYEEAFMAIRIVPAKTRGSYQVMEGTKIIGSQAFTCTDVTEVLFPASVETIDVMAFIYADKLETVHMEEGVEKINNSAFRGCISLRDITIPRSVKAIGEAAFQGCTSLQSVTVSRDCEIAADAFDEGVEITYY